MTDKRRTPVPQVKNFSLDLLNLCFPFYSEKSKLLLFIIAAAKRSTKEN